MPRSINRVVLRCGMLALTVVAGGCQRGPTWNLAPVEGTVTKGGRPQRGIEVVFLPDPDAGTLGPRTSAITDEAGHYRLRTDNGDKGAVAGKYRIVIRDAETRNQQFLQRFRGPQRKEATQRLSPEMAKRLEEQWKTTADALRVPPRYGRFNETPLRVEVQPGPQTLDFDVP